MDLRFFKKLTMFADIELQIHLLEQDSTAVVGLKVQTGRGQWTERHPSVQDAVERRDNLMLNSLDMHITVEPFIKRFFNIVPVSRSFYRDSKRNPPAVSASPYTTSELALANHELCVFEAALKRFKELRTCGGAVLAHPVQHDLD